MQFESSESGHHRCKLVVGAEVHMQSAFHLFDKLELCSTSRMQACGDRAILFY